MQPYQLFEKMGLSSYQLIHITHGENFEHWGIRLPDKAVVQLGAPMAIQPLLHMDRQITSAIDTAYPVSVQVLDPLQRSGRNHVAARRRLKKAMTDAGFIEARFSESPHAMHMVFVAADYSANLSDWLTSVTKLEPNFIIDTASPRTEPPNVAAIQLPDLHLSGSPSPPANARLDEIEKRWKLQLPDDYYAFLLKYNGGVPSAGNLTFADSNGPMMELTIQRFLSVFPAAQFSPFNLETVLETQLDRLPDGLIPIALCELEDENGWLCLGVSGEAHGEVVICDPDTSESLVVAASVPELLKQLSPI